MTFLTILVAIGVVTLGGNSNECCYGMDVTKAANFAINFHNRISKYAFAYKVVSILSATSEIFPPARVKYTMTVKVGQTVCENKANISLPNCSFQDFQDAKIMICNFVVLSIPHSAFPSQSYLLLDHCN
ncbi:hypothetical protein UPYG_G00069110 [Umbra pygmaea]|uniref:Cystatin domain-containing protein n=1 Tax=Umbra pygmaea TaxID=75934 RepID=A0ABD0XB53_UMBPY